MQVLTATLAQAKMSRLKTQRAGKFGMLTAERSAEGSESPVKLLMLKPAQVFFVLFFPAEEQPSSSHLPLGQALMFL